MAKRNVSEQMDQKTGEIPMEQLNKIIEHRTIRPDGTMKVQLDFSNCPSMAEQHTAHLSDINYLIARYKPDELAAYITARNQYRQEILGHDFSEEPNLQEAKNVVVQLKKDFEALPEEIKTQFRSHVEFLKFIDNPANQAKMIKLGLLTQKEIEKHTEPEKTISAPETTNNANSNAKK